MSAAGSAPGIFPGGETETYGEELQVEAVRSIAELELYDPVGAYLGHRGNATRLEKLSQSSHKGGGCGGRRPAEMGQMASKTRVDDQLFLVVRLRKLHEYNLGGEVVYIDNSQRHETRSKLVGNDLDAVQ